MKKDEEDNSVNSEIIKSDEKSVSDKINYQRDMATNVIVSASFTRNSSDLINGKK